MLNNRRGDKGVPGVCWIKPVGNDSSQRQRPWSEEFEKQVLAHTDMLYAVALRMTRDPSEAEDLAQNTVLKALRFHDKFKEGTYIKAWLLTILRNTFINDYRSKVRRPVFVELSGLESVEEQAPEIKAVAAGATALEANLLELLDAEVRQALDSLAPEFRQAVIMADLEDRSYKEIAEKMGCPVGTVMSRLYRGRRLLRAKLQEYAAAHGIKSAQPKKKKRAVPPSEPRI